MSASRTNRISKKASGPAKAPDPRKNIGAAGERYCESHFERLGFQILERNWTCRYGEIDLICGNGKALVFVEVKTRLASAAARKYLFETVTRKKQRKLELLAGCYLRYRCGRNRPAKIRIDVVGVLLTRESLRLVELIHLPAAISASW